MTDISFEAYNQVLKYGFDEYDAQKVYSIVKSSDTINEFCNPTDGLYVVAPTITFVPNATPNGISSPSTTTNGYVVSGYTIKSGVVSPTPKNNNLPRFSSAFFIHIIHPAGSFAIVKTPVAPHELTGDLNRRHYPLYACFHGPQHIQPVIKQQTQSLFQSPCDFCIRVKIQQLSEPIIELTNGIKPIRTEFVVQTMFGKEELEQINIDINRIKIFKFH